MRMPSVEPTPQALTGPERAVWVPIRISVSVTPSSASAGAASAPARSPPAASLDSFLIFPSPLPTLLSTTRHSSCCVARAADRAGSSRRSGVHPVDQLTVFLLHQAALELHGGGELLVLGGEQLVDQL